jgi:hypothetical protein
MDEQKVCSGPDDPGAAVPVAPENNNGQPASTTEAVMDESSVKVESSAMEIEKVESSEKTQVTLEPPKTEQKTTNMEESGEADDSSKATSRAPTPTSIINNSNRKVIIQNVYKFVDKKKVEKMAATWFKDIQELSEEGFKIELESVKKPPKENWTVLTLKDEAMVQPLIDYINNNGIANKKGSKLFAKIAEDKSGEIDDRKRKAGNSNDENANKRQRTARRPVTEDEVRDKVTPLWRKTKEEQLIAKSREMVKKCAMKIVQEVKGRFRYVPVLLVESCKRASQSTHTIVYFLGPTIDPWRRKETGKNSKFTIGFSSDGPSTVLRSYRRRRLSETSASLPLATVISSRRRTRTETLLMSRQIQKVSLRLDLWRQDGLVVFRVQTAAQIYLQKLAPWLTFSTTFLPTARFFRTTRKFTLAFGER